MFFWFCVKFFGVVFFWFCVKFPVSPIGSACGTSTLVCSVHQHTNTIIVRFRYSSAQTHRINRRLRHLVRFLLLCLCFFCLPPSFPLFLFFPFPSSPPSFSPGLFFVSDVGTTETVQPKSSQVSWKFGKLPDGPYLPLSINTRTAPIPPESYRPQHPKPPPSPRAPMYSAGAEELKQIPEGFQLFPIFRFGQEWWIGTSRVYGLTKKEGQEKKEHKKRKAKTAGGKEKKEKGKAKKAGGKKKAKGF